MDPATDYLGLDLKNPLVASASPLPTDLHDIRRTEDSGSPLLYYRRVSPGGLRH